MTIGTIFILGSGLNLVMLGGTFGALAYKKSGFDFYLRSIERIMPAHIAHMLYSRKTKEKMLFTQDESREVIDWLESSFSKQKNYISFFTNIPLLIGLFGTFTGLLTSIDDMGRIVITLGSGNVELGQVIKSFSGPLAGMAVGFGSSLFAVGIATLLGIKGYILFKYQDILIEGVQQWLKDRIVDVSLDSSANGLPEKRKSFLDLFITQMENFTKEIGKIGESNKAFLSMADSINELNKNIQDEKDAISNIALLLEEKSEKSFKKLGDIDEGVRNIAENISDEKDKLQTIQNSIDNGTKELIEQIRNTGEVSNKTIESLADSYEEISKKYIFSIDELKSSFETSQSGLGEKLTHSILSVNEVIEGLKKDSHRVSEHTQEILRDSIHKIEVALNEGNGLLTKIDDTNRQSHKDGMYSFTKISSLIESLDENIIKNRETIKQLSALQEKILSSNSDSFSRFISLITEIGENLISIRKTFGDVSDADLHRFNHFKDALEGLKSELLSIKESEEKTVSKLDTLNLTYEKQIGLLKSSFGELKEEITEGNTLLVQTKEEISQNGKKLDEVSYKQEKLNDISEKIGREIEVLEEVEHSIKNIKISEGQTRDNSGKISGFLDKFFRH